LAVRWFTIQWKHMIRLENTYRKRIFTGRPHFSRTIRDNGFNRNKEQDHMPINSKYVFVASMDVDLDKEGLFNEVYDTEHIPNLLNVSGVHSATRVKGEPFALSIGGGKTNIPHEGARYSARCAPTHAIGGTPCTRSFRTCIAPSQDHRREKSIRNGSCHRGNLLSMWNWNK